MTWYWDVALIVALFGILMYLSTAVPAEPANWIMSTSQSQRAFPVLPVTDATDAAQLLSSLSFDIDRLVAHLQHKFPTDPRVKRVRSQWQYQKLAEGRYDEENVTSYTVNKGERIVLCLRSREGHLHDSNLIMYVLLHELAHICSVSKSVQYHNKEFQTNLKWILAEATALNLYQHNTKRKAVTYCGMSDVMLP